jgi:ABC-type phosphate transport system substrate-binding protein
MAEIQISIESQNADTAAEDLFTIKGLEGSWELVSESSPNKEGTLAVIGTIVGIVGGGIAIAEQIRKWYKEYKQSHPDKQFDVVIIGSSGRVVMEDATIEEIYEVLRALEK